MLTCVEGVLSSETPIPFARRYDLEISDMIAFATKQQTGGLDRLVHINSAVLN